MAAMRRRMSRGLAMTRSVWRRVLLQGAHGTGRSTLPVARGRWQTWQLLLTWQLPMGSWPPGPLCVVWCAGGFAR